MLQTRLKYIISNYTFWKVKLRTAVSTVAYILSALHKYLEEIKVHRKVKQNKTCINVLTNYMANIYFSLSGSQTDEIDSEEMQ